MAELGSVSTFYPAETVTANKLEADKSTQNRTKMAAKLINDIKKTLANVTVELGTNPAGNASTVDARLKQIENATGESITATSSGVAANVDKVFTVINTNGDGDEDNVTLANPSGTNVGYKVFMVNVTSGDTLKITPASLAGSNTKISFADASRNKGCILAWDQADESWVIVGNNGGTIA